MNMTFHSMLELEGMMAVLMAVGYLVYRRGIVTEKGKQSLVNLCIRLPQAATYSPLHQS